MRFFNRLIVILLLSSILTTGCGVTKGENAQTTSETLNGDGLVVLCYHRILPYWTLKWGKLLYPSNSELSRYAISIKEFKQQLNYLTKK